MNTKWLSTSKKHKKEVANLKSIESDLMELIANTGSETLMDKSYEWLEQRSLCNSLYNDMLKDMLIEKTK